MPSDTQEETLEEDRGEEEEEHEEENHETTSAATTLSLSPPALYRDRVLISIQARIGQEVLLYLVCLDSAGNEVWITFLGSSQGINYLGLAARNSVPLVSESTIYQLSNTGVLAALDAEDGTLLWINEQGEITQRYGKIHLFDIDVPGKIRFFGFSCHAGNVVELLDAADPETFVAALPQESREDQTTVIS